MTTARTAASPLRRPLMRAPAVLMALALLGCVDVLDGAPCQTNADCLGALCVGGRCGPGDGGPFSPSCVAAHQSCQLDADCCSETCVLIAGSESCPEQGICALGPAMCGALLASCTVNGDCCSGSCSVSEESANTCPPTGTCTGGSGMCIADGDACLLDSDCCNGGGNYGSYCQLGGCDYRQSSNGMGQCSPNCTALGCSGGYGSCCTGYAGPSPSNSSVLACQACPSSPGALSGQSCFDTADCCGLTCIGASSESAGTCG